MQITQFDGTCLDCLSCQDSRHMLSCLGSHFRAHFSCFLGFFENKLIILSIYVKKVDHNHKIMLLVKSEMVCT